MTRPSEVTTVHTRILRCTLGVSDARAYWSVPELGPWAGRTARAFSGYWFGARSHARVEVLLANLRLRFDAYPQALAVLRAWPDMDPAVRTLVCHWHLQLADPLYRAFTGDFLVARRGADREGPRTVTLAQATAWVTGRHEDRWTMHTRMEFGRKLLAAAAEAGLVGSRQDPRPLSVPRVPDEALLYLLHLLRGVEFAGTLLDNPYLASVGLLAEHLPSRLRTLAGLRFAAQGELMDLDWAHPSLPAWFSDWRSEGAA